MNHRLVTVGVVAVALATAATAVASATPLGSTLMPTTSAAAPTSTTAPAESGLTFTPGTPFAVPLGLWDEPALVPTAVRPPTPAHGWLLIGDYRSSPGKPSEVGIYEAAGPQQPWTSRTSSGASGPSSISYAVTTTPDGQETIFGSIDNAPGPVPAWWTFDGTALSTPHPIETSSVPGYVSAAALDDDGTMIVAIQRFPGPGVGSFDVARRSPDGTWTTSLVPGVDETTTIAGVAIRGATVSIIGWAVVDGNEQALAWVSTDSGATFVPGDTSNLEHSAGTRMGKVVAGDDGFYAAYCAESLGRGHAFGFSADGVTWTKRYFSSSGMVTIDGSDCWSIQLDPGGGGIWLGSADGDFATAYRVSGTAVDETDTIERGDIPVPFFDSPVFAVSADGVGIMQPVNLGVVAGVAARAPGSETVVQPGDGPPGLHEGADVFSEIDTDRNLVGIGSYPAITPLADGSWLYGFQFFPQAVDAHGVLSDTSTALPSTDRAIDYTLVGNLEASDVAVWSAVDANLGPANPDGVGDLWMSRRPHGAEWSAPEPLVQLLGEQRFGEGILVGEGLMVAGVDNSPSGSRPLIVYVDGDGAGRVSVEPADARLIETEDGCALGRDHALLFGSGQEGPGVLTIDITALRATYGEVDPAITGVFDCASTGDEVVVAASTADGPAFFATADGSGFTRVAGLEPGDRPGHMAEGPSGIAAIGRCGPGDGDSFLVFGSTPETLQRVNVPGLTGPGDQRASLAMVRAGQVLVFGFDDGAPTVWPVAIS